MKKYFGLLICMLMSLFVFNTTVSAKTEMTTLPQAVQEEINYFGNSANFSDDSTFQAYQTYVDVLKAADLSSYEESDNKVNVYIFRGSTCWHCLDEITWLADNYKDYSQYINVHTYETWGNKENSKLMNSVAKLLGKTASGVPFTVVGKETFSGFGESTGSQIIEAAKKQYENSERYDIKDHIDLDTNTLKDEGKKSSTIAVIVLIASVMVGGAVLIYLICKSK